MATPSKKPKKNETETLEFVNEPVSEEYKYELIPESFDYRFLGSDYSHGIKELLQQLFLKSDIDLGQLTDMLIGQIGIGSLIIKDLSEESMAVYDENTVFAVTSVLNLTADKENFCIKQLYSLLERLTAQHAREKDKEAITKILQQNYKIGFLIHERLVNIPRDVSVPMFHALRNDIDEVKKTNDAYDFDYLIIISKTIRPKVGRRRQIFTNQEEQLFYRKAKWTFDFNVEDESDFVFADWLPKEKQWVPFRRVTIFKASVFRDIVDTQNNGNASP
ncbi:unnamed protein product [Ceutorhynchus assimilis]|uniref:Protein BCCIP homolog n=1 Tax=Ceutorhynchus assimilis TaxID=467358 RepID=A0A9N9Q8I8_9CUCU|nr:unnamed protein product [Ceutorhynchus assimilis]